MAKDAASGYCPVCEAYDLLGYEYDVVQMFGGKHLKHKVRGPSTPPPLPPVDGYR